MLDNATSHAVDLELSNIVLESFRPNMTAYLQPCDVGIIRNFKLYYRQRQVRHFLECIELEKEMKVKVKETLQFISSAWDAVTPLTIQNCWEHTGIIPHTDDLMQIPRIDRDPKRFPEKSKSSHLSHRCPSSH